jgi:Hemopexin
MVKRIYFFKDGFCFEYDPRPGTDRVVKGPTPIGSRFKGLNSTFAMGIQAAVNWGDGFVYLFKGDEYWKYDALRDRVDTPTLRKIQEGWPTFPPAFAAGIDAAFNSGEGKAYFFKGNQYLRYDVATDRVDAPDPGTSPYPRAIADPNGWRGLTASFESGIDAAANAGDGKIYFFKGNEYVRLTFASRSVDLVDPPYPRAINPAWSGLASNLDAAVEWIQAGSATLEIVLNPLGCPKVLGPGILDAALGRAFTMTAAFSTTGYPSLCGCAEYRQFVRGTMTINGAPVDRPLPDPAGGPPIKLLPRPAPGSPDDNFREDGDTRGPVPHYGHRNAGADPKGIYDQPDQRSGCRYQGIDSPLVSGIVGNAVVLDLDFRGMIVDVSADNEVLVEKTWSISCSGVL